MKEASVMSYRERAEVFCKRFGLRIPVLMAPMAGSCPPELAAAVANAGGLGACGALVLSPEQIGDWARAVRGASNGAFQVNLWIPDPPPARDPEHEAKVREFLGRFGPEVPPEAGDVKLIDFDAQCAAILEAAPPIVSSIMGLYPPDFVREAKTRGISWFANATTVAEAREAEAAGADVIVAQGAEAGGHRGAFDPALADRALVGLFALLPAIVDAVKVPVVATGGIADGRTAAAAFALGASAVQVGTALLRTPEARTHSAWADALEGVQPEDTIVTRAFSGRPGRALANAYARAAAAPDAPAPAPYPVQRGLAAAMRVDAAKANDAARLQSWAGQAARLARPEPAGQIVERIWSEAQALLA